jgi:hypothetical protein
MLKKEHGGTVIETDESVEKLNVGYEKKMSKEEAAEKQFTFILDIDEMLLSVAELNNENKNIQYIEYEIIKHGNVVDDYKLNSYIKRSGLLTGKEIPRPGKVNHYTIISVNGKGHTRGNVYDEVNNIVIKSAIVIRPSSSKILLELLRRGVVIIASANADERTKAVMKEITFSIDGEEQTFIQLGVKMVPRKLSGYDADKDGIPIECGGVGKRFIKSIPKIRKAMKIHPECTCLMIDDKARDIEVGVNDETLEAPAFDQTIVINLVASGDRWEITDNTYHELNTKFIEDIAKITGIPVGRLNGRVEKEENL